ncbi:aldehyde oxidoreductase molybdenum-binding subunit PaoC [Scandinavium lactucae]|uniref:Aldehyde oxidoreductase molybdenum-binding subunit PaoC n=1 Tax=Scandinavium lactucae TaxID=3095028 RepID=A0ABU4QJ71_9ENTR|nr:MULTISPECIES: aldehyde oxidoreductase molybdenum-binding subunit PaoC [unclassified Scandinavium]MDX6039349.1 aldehyde oxidoreductase molybdenum-binding subunit PaoC [Scandinavium sp. V105_6]MDX6050420.1 aldehyde oxidoreductase molybdenum-binding subunit PaoC [Scandinavium sp. V105_1]
MKFDKPAGENPIDRLTVVGRPHDRIDGPLKTTGTAHYAYEWHDKADDVAYGYVVGSAIAKGRITTLKVQAAQQAPGVLGVITADNAGPLDKGERNTAMLLGGPVIEHYHQAIALVVADTFEQARAAAGLVQVEYQREPGEYSLAQAKPGVTTPPEDAPDKNVGDFDAAWSAAAVKLDATYTTPDQSHLAMEPHASMAVWEGDTLTLWTSNQMIDWCRTDLAKTLRIPKDKIRIISPYIGGGFGGKLFLRSDALLAALAARAVKRPVKVMLPRPLIANNTTHRPATLQHIRLGSDSHGKITAIAHDSWSGNLPGGTPETAVQQTELLYAGANRHTGLRLATLSLPEGNAMRAPGEAPGLMALEIAIDELAEKAGIDPVEFRILNDTQVDPADPSRPFSRRQLIECLRTGADHFDWKQRNPVPAQVRDGRWLVGYGVAAGFRNNLLAPSGARVHLDANGNVTVETDMTDIGTGSYTIIAQTAAEMLGVPMANIEVKLGDSHFPVSAGSGGQWGANTSTAGVYAACVKLRDAIAKALGFDPDQATFAEGKIRDATHSAPLADAAKGGTLTVEETIEFGDLDEQYQQSTFAGHFVEVGVDAATGEVRVRRMLAVCAAGRILNPKTARSQVIGAMTMGLGGALMEELAVDNRLGYFVNHDMAGYEVPVHADVPQQEVIFLDDTDPISSPMKAKGVGELGLCGVSAAIANAIYNATGARVRDYPMTLDKLLHALPDVG